MMIMPFQDHEGAFPSRNSITRRPCLALQFVLDASVTAILGQSALTDYRLWSELDSEMTGLTDKQTY